MSQTTLFVAPNAATHLMLSALVVAITFLSCGKSKVETDVNALPLITTSDELTAASDKAGDRMVVLDLYADWCMPCRVLSPVLHELAVEYKDNAYFYRVNVDQSPDLARAFSVRGIPYVVFMKQNKAVYALTGVNPKESYRKILDICKGAASADECTGKLNERM
jgi:thioredoxin